MAYTQVKKNQYPTVICVLTKWKPNEMVHSDIACNCIVIGGIAFQYASILIAFWMILIVYLRK